MKIKKILIMLILYFCVTISLTNIYATDFWGNAGSWFSGIRNSVNMPAQANDIIEIFESMINVVGTTVIVVATIVLGIKYIIGTVDSRTQAKDGLITLFVACVFFFGWTSISNLLFPSNNFIFLSDIDININYSNMVGRLFSTFSYIANIVSIILIIYVGVRYILAGATGKADLKGRSIYFIIGIILIFATSNVLTFISNVINEVF